jgi:hypothetical protein
MVMVVRLGIRQVGCQDSKQKAVRIERLVVVFSSISQTELPSYTCHGGSNMQPQQTSLSPVTSGSMELAE